MKKGSIEDTAVAHNYSLLVKNNPHSDSLMATNENTVPIIPVFQSTNLPESQYLRLLSNELYLPFDKVCGWASGKTRVDFELLVERCRIKSLSPFREYKTLSAEKPFSFEEVVARDFYKNRSMLVVILHNEFMRKKNLIVQSHLKDSYAVIRVNPSRLRKLSPECCEFMESFFALYKKCVLARIKLAMQIVLQKTEVTTSLSLLAKSLDLKASTLLKIEPIMSKAISERYWLDSKARGQNRLEKIIADVIGCAEKVAENKGRVTWWSLMHALKKPGILRNPRVQAAVYSYLLENNCFHDENALKDKIFHQ